VIIRATALVVLLTACVGSPPTHYVTFTGALANLRLRLPPNGTAGYFGPIDRWFVAVGSESAVLSPAAPNAVASPDAFKHAREVELRTARFEITARESLSDGFSTTLVEHAGAERSASEPTTFVVRQLGNVWVQCVGAVSLCKSLKRG